MTMRSSTMDPTISKNSMVLVNKLAFSSDGPQKNDIVLWRHFTDKNNFPWKYGLHRIVAVPGDEIMVAGRAFSINNGPRITQMLNTVFIVDSDKVLEDEAFYRLAPDEYLIGGDNRLNSTLFILKRANIIGKIVWPK